MKGAHPLDPTGLIQEAYRIDGITPEDCRVIFFDWAVGARGGKLDRDTVQTLIDTYAANAPDHPMTQVLREGLEKTPAPPARRGGWRARRS